MYIISNSHNHLSNEGIKMPHLQAKKEKKKNPKNKPTKAPLGGRGQSRRLGE